MHEYTSACLRVYLYMYVSKTSLGLLGSEAFCSHSPFFFFHIM